MNLKQLADKAKQVIDERGGTDRLKRDAERLRGIATGPGTAKEKAKAATDALKEPAPDRTAGPKGAGAGAEGAGPRPGGGSRPV